MKLGVSRDAIKATLMGAGWQAGDVEDTLKKVDASAAAVVQPAAKPAEPPVTSRIVTPVGSSTPSSSPAPQTIKVSDLVSGAAVPASSPTPAAKPAASKNPMTGPAPVSMPMKGTISPAAGASGAASSYPSAKMHGSRGPLITEIVLGVVALAALAFAGFLYMQNGSLNGKLNSLQGQSTDVNSQLSSLQAQVAASTTALTAQVASLGDETQELQTELSFYVAPSSTTPGATSTATVEGVVYSGKTAYIITAAYGAKIAVANSKDAAVIAALAPLMAGTSTPATTAQFTGTYTPGIDSMTLTAVNGTAVQ
ncbi:MAG TPA: hypothetical protein VMA75_04430 [Candidatus Paceibacterota bacterium]|nr:hypothetical protein [Candidatus Paceibacterota bacterium]